MNFYDEAGDWVVDDAGYDRLSTFGFESMLVAVELITMASSVMFFVRGKDKTLISWTSLIIHNDVGILRFPYKINITADDTSVFVFMAEWPFMMSFDRLAIKLFKGCD